ncbi:MAG TPA: hypothetical protein DDW52_00455 [Planctomycetaceae bacterium]|nr:hypothetical protein [Planctomycetaceae bacterium]
MGDGTPSGEFMNETGDAYRQLPLEDVVKVVAEEMEAAHERSIAVFLWQFAGRGISIEERVSEDSLLQLIAQANKYQSGSPSIGVLPSLHNGQALDVISQWNVSWTRNWLLDVANKGLIPTERIAGIRDWLTGYWAPADTFQWISNTELLAKTEQTNRGRTQPAASLSSEFWEQPWPLASDSSAIKAAAKLGIEVPISVRFITAVENAGQLPPEELVEMVGSGSLSDAQLKTLANMFVLKALPKLVPPNSAGNSGFNPLAYGQRSQPYINEFAGNVLTGNQFSASHSVITDLLRASELWIGRLEDMRRHTDMQANLDAIVREMHRVVSQTEIPVVPNPLSGIAFVESTVGSSGSSAFTGGMGGGGMGGSQPPSAEDIAKAKAIKAKLDAYLERRQGAPDSEITEQDVASPTNKEEAQATPGVDSRYASIDPAKLSAVYQGKSVLEHLATLENELHVPTLVDSINAISRVAEPGDTQLVRAAIFPSRRYGGLTKGGGSPSGDFMLETQEAYRQLPLTDVIKVIVEEMERPHERSIAMFLMHFVYGGIAIEEEVAKDSIEHFISGANAYQAGRPSSPFQIYLRDRKQTETIARWNVSRIRDFLLALAADDFVPVEQLADIRTWLPSYWAPLGEVDWVTNGELFSQLDNSIDEHLALGSIIGRIKETFEDQPWPIAADPNAIKAASQLGVAVPVLIRFITLSESTDQFTPEELSRGLSINSKSQEQLKTLANGFVLSAFLAVKMPSGAFEDGSGKIVMQSGHRLMQNGSQFSGDSIRRINTMLRCSEIWIDHLDDLRAHTDMPTVFNAVVRNLHFAVSDPEIPSAPSPLGGIAYTESTIGPTEFIVSQSVGYRDMDRRRLSVSAEDITKAKAIKAKLDAYLGGRQADVAQE